VFKICPGNSKCTTTAGSTIILSALTLLPTLPVHLYKFPGFIAGAVERYISCCAPGHSGMQTCRQQRSHKVEGCHRRRNIRLQGTPMTSLWVPFESVRFNGVLAVVLINDVNSTAVFSHPSHSCHELPHILDWVSAL
jgi:hypothetical protein